MKCYYFQDKVFMLKEIACAKVNDEHVNFVISSLKSADIHKIPRDVVFEYMFANGTIKLLVNDDEEVIYGCICYNEPALYWIYIKESFRCMGLADKACENKEFKEFWIKGRAKAWQKWTRKRKLKWNPYSILN